MTTQNGAGVIDPVAGVEKYKIASAFGRDKNKLTVIDVARLCHEINRTWCQLMGDDSQAPWEDAPEWQKESAVNGVIFLLQNKTATPRDSHMSWLSQKQQEGWKWGEVKNPEKKEHPCFCSFENLPWNQQVKDHLFFNVVRALQHTMDTTQELTAGERTMGITFNPSRDWRIDLIKGKFAELYDYISRFAREQFNNPYTQDQFAKDSVWSSLQESQRQLQTAKMYAVEALTR